MTVLRVFDGEFMKMKIALECLKLLRVWILERHPHETVGLVRALPDVIERNVGDFFAALIGGAVDEHGAVSFFVVFLKSRARIVSIAKRVQSREHRGMHSKRTAVASLVRGLCALVAVIAAPDALAKETLKKKDTSTALAAGLSPERLVRIGATMQRYVDEKRVAGTVTLFARHGQVIHFEAHGFADIEAKRPMTTDTIFRIASMSKAVTSAAIMMLVEEGLVSLEHPVSRYIPAFKKSVVAVRAPMGSWEGAPPTLVPPKREITIRDLLTHTAGISYGYGPAAAQWKAAGIQNWYFADRAEPIAAVVDRIAQLPFDAQPGEAFVYGYNTDILGVVVEKASGLNLDTFFRERIFRPLKMVDTHFFLPPEKRNRLAVVYAPQPDGTVARAPEGAMGQGAYVEGPRQCFSGGAGLLSTANDYLRLMKMFAQGGELDGVRLLGPKTVELMSTNHVGNMYNEGRTGFGLGFEVVEHIGRAGRYGSEDAYGWGSAYYSNYWIDPAEDMMGIYLSQLLPNGGLDLQTKFRTLAYSAITKSSRSR